MGVEMEPRGLRLFLEEIAREGGELALGHFGRARVEAKGESVVSEADRAVERHLVSRIRSKFPGDYILAEESGANGPARPGPGTRWWTIDPIDGTGPYLSRLPFWSVSVACLRGPRVEGAVVHMAALGEVFSAVEGEAPLRNGQPLPSLPPDPAGKHSYLFVPCREVEGLEIGFGGRKLSLAAASVALSYTAAGSAFGTVLEPNRAYDFGPAAFILERAGGAVRYLSGEEIDYAELADGRTTPGPVVAAPAAQVDWLRKQVSWGRAATSTSRRAASAGRG
ncbi:MAG: inositol monophosphatase family protein [Nitrospinota bacterium]